jgi:hypothetical protein
MFTAKPLTQIGYSRIDGIAVNNDAVFFGHAPRVPAGARRTALRHRTVGFGKGVAFAHKTIHGRCVESVIAEYRHHIGVHLIDVDE